MDRYQVLGRLEDRDFGRRAFETGTLRTPSNCACCVQLGPHTHPDDRTLTVLSGSWYEGFGDKLDRANAKLLPLGGFTTIPGNAMHFDIVGPEGAMLQVSGNGPIGTIWLNAADNPAANCQ